MQIKQMNSMYILDLTSKVYMLKVLIVIVNNIIDEWSIQGDFYKKIIYNKVYFQ